MISSRIFDEVSGGRECHFRSSEASPGFFSNRWAAEKRGDAGKAQMENREQNAEAARFAKLTL